MSACTYCGGDERTHGGRFGLEQDHVIPRYWPGAHLIKLNFTPACRDCNQAKGTNDPATWFFLLVRRDGAVLGRGETLADIRVNQLWRYWADDIRHLHNQVAAMLSPIGVAS